MGFPSADSLPARALTSLAESHSLPDDPSLPGHPCPLPANPDALRFS